MFLAMHGRESPTDAFAFFLAEKLHKTVGEIMEMPYPEYQGWHSYYTVKTALEEARGGVQNRR